MRRPALFISARLTGSGLVRRALPALPAVLAASGCASMAGQGALATSEGPEVPWDIVPVVWSATEVFERYGFPLAVVDEQGGRVETGRMRVQVHWEGVPVERIVDCPTLSAARDPQVYSLPFDLTMFMNARDTGEGTTRIRVSGLAHAVDAGVGSGREVRCVVREEFRNLIADEIRRDVMHLPPRRHSRGGAAPA